MKKWMATASPRRWTKSFRPASATGGGAAGLESSNFQLILIIALWPSEEARMVFLLLDIFSSHGCEYNMANGFAAQFLQLDQNRSTFV
ncbi:hypothetical protein Taro_041604 [Colocasia esculenta]|uniref:Uncharacterized protein n=1 Tax=Colocasia esculenta TaxID=4460 RepID=A0A843WLV9_COLES|nr:hypothetical protein [Colocasia esculenta]